MEYEDGLRVIILFICYVIIVYIKDMKVLLISDFLED
jgi:hypothetical protein